MENQTIEILVVEDKESHMNDVKHMLEQRQEAGVALNVTYATNLEEAYSAIPKIDGIISDVFFPETDSANPENQAYKIIDKAKELGKPIVLCTDGDHHGPDLQELTNKLGIHKKDDIYLGMVDFATQSPRRTKITTKARRKNWPRAYFQLMLDLAREEREAFQTYVKSLDIDTEQMFHNYYGPSFEDLEKVLGEIKIDGAKVLVIDPELGQKDSEQHKSFVENCSFENVQYDFCNGKDVEGNYSSDAIIAYLMQNTDANAAILNCHSIRARKLIKQIKEEQKISIPIIAKIDGWMFEGEDWGFKRWGASEVLPSYKKSWESGLSNELYQKLKEVIGE